MCVLFMCYTGQSNRSNQNKITNHKSHHITSCDTNLSASLHQCITVCGVFYLAVWLMKNKMCAAAHTNAAQVTASNMGIGRCPVLLPVFQEMLPRPFVSGTVSNHLKREEGQSAELCRTWLAAFSYHLAFEVFLVSCTLELSTLEPPHPDESHKHLKGPLQPEEPPHKPMLSLSRAHPDQLAYQIAPHSASVQTLHECCQSVEAAMPAGTNYVKLL